MKPDSGLERRRELNRLAAQKLRNRQKEHAINIRQEYFNAQSNNTRLVYEKKQLHKEREALKSSLDMHLRFCQQQNSSLVLGNHIIYFAAPAGSMSQPILLADVDQNIGDRTGTPIADDSQNENSELDNSRGATSGNEEYDDSVAQEDVKPQIADVLESDDDSEGLDADKPPLVIIEDGVKDHPVQEVASNVLKELPVTTDNNVENESRSDAVIPIMVLDMNEN